MKPTGAFVGILSVCGLAWAAEIKIPVLSGPFVVDGKPDEAFWRGARTLALISPERPLVDGGEVRIANRGNHLCMSARLPEPDRVVAHSTGRNPHWWAEDTITWDIRVHSSANGRNVNLSLTINPFGAYELNGATGMDVSAAAATTTGLWTVEAAIPLQGLGQIGFMHARRVRALRPDAPELHWDWPAPFESDAFRVALSEGTQPPVVPAPHPVSPPHPEPRVPIELAWIPPNAWTETQRNELHISQMLENSLRKRLAAVAENEKEAWQKVDSRESWERFRDQRLATLREWLGPMPPRTPLHTTVTRKADYGDGFTVENVVFESRPHLLVTANLYLPERTSERVPAIIVVHSHHAPKTQSELQDLGMTWARSGTAVLVMDQLCAGERSQSQPWPRESYYGRYALGNQLLLAGESLMKWMVWDLTRGIDLLLERPDIDPSRIILLGAVAGGGDPAAVTAALDSRIAAVIPFNFGEAGPEEHYTLGPRGYDFETAWPGWGEWETTRSLPRSVVGQFFPWFLCASVAPRPFLYSFEIDWPNGVEHEPAWARYKKVFQLYQKPDRLDEVHGFGPFPGPGECTNIGVLLRKRIYPVLTRWFNMKAPAAEYHYALPDSALMCMTSAVVAELRPLPASAVALSAVPPTRALFAETKDTLRRKLGDIEPVRTPSSSLLWTNSMRDVTVEALAIESEPGIKLPVYLLKPAGKAPARMPVVIAVAQAGKGQLLSQRGKDIVALLRSGIAVCLPDVRGTGELADTSARGPGAMELAATELMLGETLPGAQLKDLRTVLHYVGGRGDIDAARIAVWGDSLAETNPVDFRFDQSEMREPGPIPQHQAEPLGALLVLLAGLYEDRVAAIAARGGLVSFRSVLEDRFAHVPQDVIVPGMLRAADIPDIVAALSPRPVLLEESVDGRNRPARPVESSERLVLRERGTDNDVATWLVTQVGIRAKR